MGELAVPDRKTRAVAILFPLEAVRVIDIFRALGDFEDHYDVATLDALEARLSSATGREAAKGIVSDALLLAFGLRRERRAPMAYKAVHSRQGTLDEYCLLAIIGAAYRRDFGLAAEAAAALHVAHPEPLISLASEVARRLGASGLTLQVADRRLFRAEAPNVPAEPVVNHLGAPDLRLNFDF